MDPLNSRIEAALQAIAATSGFCACRPSDSDCDSRSSTACAIAVPFCLTADIRRRPRPAIAQAGRNDSRSCSYYCKNRISPRQDVGQVTHAALQSCRNPAFKAKVGIVAIAERKASGGR